jgi:hypothetical protein
MIDNKKLLKELDFGPYWPLLTPEQRDECYNGMGAEWMPNWSRELLDWLFDVLEMAVRIHDVDFTYGKTEQDYYDANNRMKKNMLVLVKFLIPWWRFFKRRRFRVYWIPGLYAAVESPLGWKSFIKAEKEIIKK